MTPDSRIGVTLVVRTPMTSRLKRADVTEFLAACHRHDIPADGAVTIETRIDGANTYFALVATRSIEIGAL
jgi:hypothetical protein